MARIETDPNYTAPTFSRATAATDLFKKEDVQNLAAAMSTHDHSIGKGLVLGAGSIPNGAITSAMIADGTIDTVDLATNAVTQVYQATGTVASTTTSTSLVDMLEMQVVLTSSGGPLVALLTCTLTHTTLAAAITIALNVDGGGPVGSFQFSAPGASYAFGGTTAFIMGGLPAGAHTVRGRWSTTNATATVQAMRTLCVWEFKR